MAQDLKDAKRPTGSYYPDGTYDGSPGLQRVEPIIDAKLLQSRFLGGIPMIYPVTRQKISPEELNDFCLRAINQAEIDLQTSIISTVRRLRLPFDPNLYQAFIWCEMPYKPIQKLIRLAICSASYSQTPAQNDKYPTGAEIYHIPNEWVDMSYATHGKISVNPLNPAFSAIGTNIAVGAAGATILQFIGQQGWVPAYWTIEAVIGLGTEQNEVPVIVNEIIGTKATVMLLGNLLLNYRFASQSLGVDGLSQSVSDNMQGLIKDRIQILEESYKANVKRMKTLLGNSFFVSNV